VNDGAEGGLLPGDVHVFVNVVAHRAPDEVWTQTLVSANSAISMHAPCCAITTSGTSPSRSLPASQSRP
jgi:hypothetical protein